MQCVVLAGGLATRMRPRTETIPKWLLAVAGRPFVEWQLEWLAAEGVDEVVACIGHLGQQVRDHVGDGRRFGLEVCYSEDGPALAGTAGALRLADRRGLLRPRFLVLYGDSYLRLDVSAMWQAFEACGHPAMMSVFRNDGRYDTSNAAYEGGMVTRYSKTAGDGFPLTFIDYGMVALSRSVLGAAGSSADLAVLYENLAEKRRLAGFEVTERFYEIGSPGGLAELDALLRDGAR